MDPIRVLLAEDVEILRRGLKAILSVFPDLRIAGEAGDGLEAVRLARELSPQVVLMDLSMPRMDGNEAIAEIKKSDPGIAILALTASDETEKIRAALTAGADGYLLKSVQAEELALAIRRVAAGGTYLTDDVAGLLSGSPSPSSPNAS